MLKKDCLNPGRLLSLKSYVDVPAELWKFDFLYTNFLPNYPPISIPFSMKKHPVLPKLGAFYNNLLKIHKFLKIWALSSLMKNPPIAVPNFAKKKKNPKGRHIYVYLVNLRTPPQFKHEPLVTSKIYRKWLVFYFFVFVALAGKGEGESGSRATNWEAKLCWHCWGIVFH